MPIEDKIIPVFDLSQIKRGAVIRIRRTGDSLWRNGMIVMASEAKVQIHYCNVQNGSISILEVTAADVAQGTWEFYWTTDFQTVQYYPVSSSEG